MMIMWMILVTAAAAAGAQPEVAQTPTSATFGDWVVLCADRKGLPPCEMAQAAKRKDNGEQGMRFSIAYAGDADRYGVQFQLPLGIQVQGDVLVRLDNRTDVPGFKITRCEVDGCFVDRIVSRAEINPFDVGG